VLSLILGSQHDAGRICCLARAQAADIDRTSYRCAAVARAQQQTSRTPLLLSFDGTDRQTDGHPAVT